MSDFLYEQILNLIPSKDLRAAIKETGFVPTDEDLLSIAYNCAANFDSRIEYLRLLEESFHGELKAYVSRLIQSEKQELEAFISNNGSAVYELHIKESPDAYDEKYLCASYEAALKMIPMFYQEYGCSENPSSRYSIEKRQVFSAAKGEGFAEDNMGDMLLLPNAVIFSVIVDGFSAEYCSHDDCDDCQRPCLHRVATAFPRFMQYGDVVKYLNYDRVEEYGVNLDWDKAPTHECYLIPLNNEYISFHDFKNAFYAHHHIRSEFVERISVEELPEQLQEDCIAYLEYLKNNPAWS